jgi:DNA-binding response OmpR family regulator
MLGKRVLIAEDDPSLSAYWHYVFQRRGFVVDIACDVRTAIDHYNHHYSDLLLLDYYLPDGTGVDIARYAHQPHSPIPQSTILVSSDVFLSKRLNQPFIDAIYHKPLTREEISVMLATHLAI